MDEKTYKMDEMVNSMIELASEEVRKAKQKGYFGKDLAESVCYVVKMASMSSGEMGRGYDREYGEYGNGEYGRRDRDEEYGNYDRNDGEYGARRGQRYGRTGQRYG